MTDYIQHSGRTWTSLGTGPNGRQLWPVDELLARYHFPPDIQAEMRKAFPNGVEEGTDWPAHLNEMIQAHLRDCEKFYRTAESAYRQGRLLRDGQA